MAKRNTVNQHAAVEAGRIITAIQEVKTGPGVTSKIVAISAEGALISLFVNSLSGSLNITVYTLTEDGKRQKLFDFPQVNTATPELVIKTISPTLNLIEIVCTYNGPCDYEVHVRGITSGQVSSRLLSPTTLSAKKVTQGTLPAVLIPATTETRSAVIIRNASAGVLYLGGTLAEATLATGFPVASGESIVIDIAGGQAVYAVGTVVGMDIRYMEAGE
jgi:hypothetical protein